MMNKILFAALATATLAFTSCGEDFLDREPQGGYLTPDQSEEAGTWNAEIFLGNISSCYTQMAMWGGSADKDQSHFGQKFLDMSGDILSVDMVKAANNYGWFTPMLYHQANTVSAADNDYIWKYCYELIRNANVVLDNAGSDVKEPESETNKYYWAIAKTVRAYAYMNLVNFYSGEYSESKNERCVPVYRTANNPTPAARQTVDSLYRFIRQDLEQAITAYTNSGQTASANISDPSINVARTLLGYVYLNTGEYGQAATVATTAFNEDTHQILPLNQVLTTGFNSVSNNANNWMWGIDITTEITGGIASFWAMIDCYTYGYADVGDMMCINQELFDGIAPNDIRRQWFVGDDEFQAYFGPQLAPSRKFFDPNRTISGDAVWTNDLVYMRAEEPVLIAAEAYARDGDVSNSKIWLRKLIEQRDADGTLTDTLNTMNTADALLDYIHFNWRVEMWGEGRALMTMRRFKATNKAGSNTFIPQGGGIPFKYNDANMIFVIPQSEINSNKNLND